MSTEITNYKPKKATFTVKLVKNKRQFTAVNKRAKTVVRKAGKRLHISVTDLKQLKDAGSYRFYAYTSAGTLKRIAF